MDLPREDELIHTYRSASDQELIEIALTYDSLTDEAQRVLRAEFARRGLEPPEIPEPEPDFEFQKLITIRQFRELPEAQIAKAVLDSADIPSYLRDENIVRMYCNPIGTGIQLQVREQDLAAAEALLSQSIPEPAQSDGETPFE